MTHFDLFLFLWNDVIVIECLKFDIVLVKSEGGFLDYGVTSLLGSLLPTQSNLRMIYSWSASIKGGYRLGVAPSQDASGK